MIVLAVDTAGSACSAAILRDGTPAACRSEPMHRGQAERLVPMILSMAEQAALTLSDIDLFAVTIGPGAFTGLRIGLAACSGMALAADRPIIGIGNLEAAARAVPADQIAGDTLLVALDSRRAEIFAQPFDNAHEPLAEPSCVAPDALGPLLPEGRVLVTGDAAPAAAEALSRTGNPDRVSVFEAAGPADPLVVARLAAGRAGQAGRAAPQPLYLRPPDAKPAPAPRPIAG